MSNLRERAREIKAAGEETRGEFTPGGVPLRVYQYWAQRSKHAPERENFCHYWRVVAFWAPFMAARNGAARVIDHPATIVGLVLTLITAVVWLSFTFGTFGQVSLIVLATVLGIAAVACGVLGGVGLAIKGDEARVRYDMPTFKQSLVLSILGLPVAAVAFLIVKGIQFYVKHLSQWNQQIVLSAVALSIVGFMTAVANEGILILLLVLGSFVGLLVALVGAIVGFSLLGDWIKAKRKVSETKAAQAAEEFYDEHGHYPWEIQDRREPGKVAKFFSGLGDFLILLGQVVRVNKWKICPTVDIPKDSVVE